MNTPGSVLAHLRVLLAGLVGEYTTPAGSKFPALRVTDPPSDWRITSGVEVVISQETDPTTEPLLNGEFHMRGTVFVRVIGHGMARLDPIVELILSAWPDAESRHIPGTDEILPQTTIRIPRR